MSPVWPLCSALAAACSSGPDPEQLQRINTLEQEVRNLNRELSDLRASKSTKKTPSGANLPFRLSCAPPLRPYVSQSEAMLTCRAVRPSPEGLYPQCNVIFQKEGSVETKDYFEFVMNGTPQLYTVTNFEDEPTKVNDVDGFQATFEAQHTPLPMKMLGTLLQHDDGIYAITCFATSATFQNYEEAFKRTISSFTFKR